MNNEQFLRTEMLLGTAAMERLAQAHVAVFGLGGVGSWCAEALARAGVGALTLVDHDQVGLTNLNRQAEATHTTLGWEKTEAMAARLRDIHPQCVLHLIPEKYEPAHRERFFTVSYDYIVDATGGTQGALAGMERRPGGGASLCSASAGSSGEKTTLWWRIPRFFSSFRMTRARGHPSVLEMSATRN